MEINQAGLDLIKEFEGCKLVAYPDPATHGAPYTIGYGHTGRDVVFATSWTQEQADEALEADVSKTARFVSNQLHVKLLDNQFSACCCLAYNIGIGNFAHSTLLEKVNEGDFETAAKEFLRWNKAAGKVMEGLTRRREAEQRLFLTA